METPEIQPWLFQIEPYQGESLSHFLGRFRRANELTPTGVGNGVGRCDAFGWLRLRTLGKVSL